MKICPYCGHRMEYMKERHTELSPVPVYETWYECGNCGYCISTDDCLPYDYDCDNDDLSEDLYSE